MSGRSAVYPTGLRLIHWGTALLVAAQFALALTNALVYESRPRTAEAVVQAHLSIGALVFAATVVRLVWRLAVVAPKSPSKATPVTRLAAHIVHVALYALLLALPVTGYVKLAALGFDITVFGVVTLPPLTVDVGLSGLARSAHTAGAALLSILLAGHVAAALFHTRLFGTPVLQRMWLSATKA